MPEINSRHFQFHSHLIIRWILHIAHPFAMFTILFEKKGGRAREIYIYYRNSYLHVHVILWFLECSKFLDESDRMTNCNVSL